jgi:NitT/TauT family transport system substrate-binding protein
LSAIGSAAETLKILKKTSHDIKVAEFVDDKYIRQAAKEFGADYDARLKEYAPVPFEAKDFVTGQEVVDVKSAGQIWVENEKKIRLYKDVPSTFVALDQLEKEGKRVRVAFVHDRESGLKLFADKVWYIRSGHDIAAFLEKSRAEKWAQANNGKLLTYAEARKSVGNERLALAH